MPRTSHARAFAARAVALVALGASVAVAVVEDPKEVLAQAHERDREPPPATLRFEGATVVDVATRLEWESEISPRRMTWDEARAYCAGVTANGGGFRLPTQGELSGVLAPRHDPFGADPDWFWSSSPGVRAGTAWAVGPGGWVNGNPIGAQSRVRCVREARVEVGP